MSVGSSQIPKGGEKGTWTVTDPELPPRTESMSLTLSSPLQSLAMLKDGFRTDRGSHSDLWSSSSSLESSGFLLPKQYLDVSSQTDISGSVSSSACSWGPPEGQPLGGCCDGWPPSHYSLKEPTGGPLCGWLPTQPPRAPFSYRTPGSSMSGDHSVRKSSH